MVELVEPRPDDVICDPACGTCGFLVEAGEYLRRHHRGLFSDVGGTDRVWFYDVPADGWSLDDKRQPLLPEDKLGPTPAADLDVAEEAKNNLPDLLMRWEERDGAERGRPRTAQSFCVPKAEIAAAGYDLSLNRYKEIEHEEVAHESPAAILADLRRIEAEISDGMRRLEQMLG